MSRHLVSLRRQILIVLAVTLLLLAWPALPLRAQNKKIADYDLRRISLQEGLVNQVITGICTDNRDMLWIGTQSGLFSFDGFRLKPFRFPVPNGEKASNTRVCSLVTGPSNSNLVFVTDSKQAWAIDPVHRFCLPDSALGLPEGFLKRCLQIEKSAGGFYWALCDRQIYTLTFSNNHFICRPIYQLPACKNPQLATVPNDPDGLWVLPRDTLAFYLNASAIQKFWIPKNPVNPSPIPGLIQLIFSRNRIFGWDHARNIYHFNPEKRSFELANSQFGLYDLFPAMAAVDDFLKQKPHLKVYRLIWAGQQLLGTSLGLFLLRKKLPKFNVIEPLRGEEIRGIHADSSGRWWVGTYNGLYSGNLHHDRIQHFSINGVWDFLPLSDRYYLLAQEIPRGLALWDRIANREVFDSTLLITLSSTSDYLTGLSLCRDKQGALWAGTYGRLLWAPAQRPYRFRVFQPPGSGKDLTLPFARALLPDPQSGIWAGSETGLYRIVYNFESKQYKMGPGIPELEGVFISSFYQDRRQRLWVATKGKGIACLDLNSAQKSLRWYNSSDGLCNDFTCRIEGSNADSFLWISTHNGLARLDLQTGVFHNFYEDSGFPGNEFNSAASAKFPDGTLLFGGISGLIRFHPDSMPVSNFRYKTILAFVTVYNKKTNGVDTLFVNQETSIRLPPYPEILEFQLGATEFVEPGKVRFRYRLHGLSEIWSYTNGEREAKFIRLGPGAYTFEVQAIPLDGHFGKPVYLQLLVGTPYYETSWFRVLVLAIIASIAYGAYRYRLIQILREQKIRRQIADDLHDDIGNKLNIISILAQKIAGSLQQAPESGPRNSLQKLTEVSRDTLSSLHTMIWSVDPTKDRLENLFTRMQDFADDYLRALGIQCIFHLPDPIPEKRVRLKVRHHIMLLYQELLTNMVKHAHPRKITVTFQIPAANKLNLILRNDYDQSLQQQFITTSANRGQESLERRLQLINGKIINFEINASFQSIELTFQDIITR